MRADRCQEKTLYLRETCKAAARIGLKKRRERAKIRE